MAIALTLLLFWLVDCYINSYKHRHPRYIKLNIC